MSYRWSLAENDEVSVDEEGEEICAECGEMTWEPLWDDDPLCRECYEHLFG